MALAAGVIFVAMVLTAHITGHWQSAVSNGELRMLVEMIDSPMLFHPSF